MDDTTTFTNTGYRTEWWHRRPFYTRAFVDEIEKRMKKTAQPPANVTNIADAKAKRTTGGKKSWSMKQGDESKGVAK